MASRPTVRSESRAGDSWEGVNGRTRRAGFRCAVVMPPPQLEPPSQQGGGEAVSCADSNQVMIVFQPVHQPDQLVAAGLELLVYGAELLGDRGQQVERFGRQRVAVQSRQRERGVSFVVLRYPVEVVLGLPELAPQGVIYDIDDIRRGHRSQAPIGQVLDQAVDVEGYCRSLFGDQLGDLFLVRAGDRLASQQASSQVGRLPAGQRTDRDRLRVVDRPIYRSVAWCSPTEPARIIDTCGKLPASGCRRMRKNSSVPLGASSPAPAR